MSETTEGTGRGRLFHATLDLLDRQLRDRGGVPCGKVDDLELERADDGTWYVTAILTGPGALTARLGGTRLGAWLRHADAVVNRRGADATRVPIELAHHIGATVDLAVDAEQLASHAGELWVREHLVDRVPGSDVDADR